MRYLGIDPGVSGGLAAVDADGTVTLYAAMPRDVAAITDIVLAAGSMTHKPRAVLEHVWSSPGWGHAGAFTFGRSFGRLEAALDGIGAITDLVTPRVWQKAMGITYPAGSTHKTISKARAVALFPTLTVTHAVADALLLAEYCRRLCLGMLTVTPANGVPHGEATKQNVAHRAHRQTAGS